MAKIKAACKVRAKCHPEIQYWRSQRTRQEANPRKRPDSDDQLLNHTGGTIISQLSGHSRCFVSFRHSTRRVVAESCRRRFSQIAPTRLVLQKVCASQDLPKTKLSPGLQSTSNSCQSVAVQTQVP